jgi:hypothetical protein
MPGRPRKTTFEQRQYVRRRAEVWPGVKRELYKVLARELKVSFCTIERIVLG